MSSVQNPVRQVKPRREKGSALLEFAIVLPLLVVFVVGIFDFSGALNTKLKIQHAAQLGAAVAAAQPTNDLDPTNANPGPDSLKSVVTVIFNSLAADGVLLLANQGRCIPPAAANSLSPPLNWVYRIPGCPDILEITINRGVLPGGAATPAGVGTTVRVHYPYHWRFGSAIQLLFPLNNSYATATDVAEDATVHNQD